MKRKPKARPEPAPIDLLLAYPNTYATWVDIWRRCEDPTHPAYPEEGAKGIKVCAE
jgi:hypothetical protein